MADESRESSKPSWKRKKGSEPEPAAAPRRSESSRHEWTKRREKPSDEVKLPKTRGLRVIAVGSAFAASVVGLIVLILMIRPPKPAAVVFVGADYAANLAVPHNIAGRKGIDRLRSVSEDSKAARRFTLFHAPGLHPALDEPWILDRKEGWSELIKKIAAANLREQTIVFVVSLHGATDADRAYLLPNLAAKPEDGLPLADVIESMKQLPESKNKVLILEGAQIPSDWRLGMVRNDFARRLADLDEQIAKVKNLWVLSGCDVGQRCWTSEGLGTTVFSHFLAESLRGAASGSDSRIYLDELHKQVSKDVRDWVWAARRAVQEPVLLPRSGGGGGTAEGKDTDKNRDRSDSGASRVFMASSVTAPASAATTAAAGDSADRETLRRAWRAFQQLDGLTPHPSVYSPRRWRLYRSTLVRCEELIRSGARNDAEELLGRLRAWEGAFSADRPLRLVKSVENTLVMNALRGGRISDRNPPAELTRFWEESRPDQLKKLWQELAASGRPASAADPLAELSPRGRADLFLMRRALGPGEIVRNLEKVADRLVITKGDDYPQPSEAHYLRMIQKNLPLADRPPRAQAMVLDALRVRMQAERAALGIVRDESSAEYPYSEQIHPWIAPLIEQADVDRRRGEDLLFGSEEQDWKEAGEAFAKAKGAYQAIADRSSSIRQALAARDRAFSELPDYSRWLARRQPRDVSDGLAETVRTLWTQVHELATSLDASSATAAVDDLAKIAKDRVWAGLDQLAKRFVDQQREYNSDRRPEDWEAATAAAAVPFPDGADLALRESVWSRLDNIRDKDIELASKRDPFQDPEKARDEQSRFLRARSSVEAGTAIAALGQAWYDQERFDASSRGKFAKDLELIERAKDEKDPRDNLPEIGQRIGARFRAIGDRLAELVPDENVLNDLKGARTRLPEADRLARRLDVRTPAPPDDLALGLSGRLRQLRGHDLLVWLARRAQLDHWYDEDPKARPYYQAVGSRYLQDALDLFPKSPEVADAQKELDAKSALAFEETQPLLFTSELRRNVPLRLIETGKVPPGIPVIRPVPGAGLAVEGSGSAGYRVATRGEAGASVGQATLFAVTSPRVRQAESDPKIAVPQADRTTFDVRGYFRGQVFERSTPIEIDPLPEVTMDGPGAPNPPASLAARASQEIVERFGGGNGSIAVVLDCSGSMTTAGSPKFTEAKRSLVAVLKQLPPKTKLSIWVFGQAAEGFVDEFHARPIDSDQSKSPELTIRQLRKTAPWDPSELEPLRKELDTLIPFHGTPLVQAMWGAKLDLDKAQGLKTMLVLTDGKDTRFAENRQFNPESVSIPKFIADNFKGAGITVNMIFFKVDEKEIKEAREQFETAISQLDPAGHFFTAQDAERLLATLQRSIKQKLTCRIVADDGKTIGELDVTGPDEETQWWTAGLEPGSYTLRVLADKAYERGIDLEKGDRMMIRLVSADGGIGFERALYSDDFPTRKDSGDAGGWRFSAAKNRYEEKEPFGALKLFTILEPTSSASGRLRQVSPRFAWFELAPQSATGNFAVRWQERGAYPATVWRGDVPRWVADPTGSGPDTPVIRAWWVGGDVAGTGAGAGQALGSATLSFTRFQDVKDQSIRTDDGTTVIVESLAIEEHPLRTRVDRDAPESVDCLVVRIRYPRGKPFLVDPGQLPGIALSGYEHRYYLRAGAYTGLFGPVSRTELDGLRSLKLVPIARLKSVAEGRKQTAELKLTQPRTDDRLPDPPQAVLKP